MKIKNWKLKICGALLLFYFLFSSSAFAALTCSVTTTCSSPDVVMLRMSGTSNAHAELPSGSSYSQLICCSGLTGLANSCNNSYEILARLSGDNNAHVEENNQSTAAYNGRNACISLPSGQEITVSYEDGSCDASDTAVFSMSKSLTNAHVGGPDAYTRKVCVDSSPVAPGGPVSLFPGGTQEGIREEALRTADFNVDGEVDIIDLSILLFHYEEGGPQVRRYDLNDSTVVDFPDASIVFYYWTAFA